MESQQHSHEELRSFNMNINPMKDVRNDTDECNESDRNELWIIQTYKALRDQGFYEPHICVTQESLVQRAQESKGSSSVVIQVRINSKVCTKAPTKIDFINALGFIRPEVEDEPRVLAQSGASREWYQFVADKIFPSCKHDRCQEVSKTDLKLIQDCFIDAPRVKLNPAREQPPYWMTDEYECNSCCKIDTEKSLSGQLADNYGYAIVKDMLERERFHARFDFLRAQVMEKRSLWKQVFVKEMKDLLTDEQPQEKESQLLQILNCHTKIKDVTKKEDD